MMGDKSGRRVTWREELADTLGLELPCVGGMLFDLQNPRKFIEQNHCWVWNSMPFEIENPGTRNQNFSYAL